MAAPNLDNSQTAHHVICMKKFVPAESDAVHSSPEPIPGNSSIEDFVVMARPMQLRVDFAARSFNSLLDELDVDDYVEKESRDRRTESLA